MVFSYSYGQVTVADGVVRALAGEARAAYERVVWGGVETGGILWGAREGGGLVIEGRTEVGCEHREGPAFELSHEDEAGLVEELRRLEGEGKTIVGWYRTTGRELRLTAPDEGLYEKWFGERWQVVLLVKRGRQEAPRFAVVGREELGSSRLVGEFGEEDMAAGEDVAEGDVAAAAVGEELRVQELVAEGTPVAVEEEGERPRAGSVVEFFGLRAEPFGMAADPEYFHRTKAHQEALRKLSYGIDGRKGFLLLIGDTACGRTTFSPSSTKSTGSAGVCCG